MIEKLFRKRLLASIFKLLFFAQYWFDFHIVAYRFEAYLMVGCCTIFVSFRFDSSQISRRMFKMISKEQIRSKTKYLIVPPRVILLFLHFAQT